MDPIAPINAAPLAPPKSDQDARLHVAAVKMEAAFLAEMLKHSGFGAAQEAFGGGVGEEQFGSFLREAQAQHLAERGGVGLAQHIFQTLKERADAR